MPSPASAPSDVPSPDVAGVSEITFPSASMVFVDPSRYVVVVVPSLSLIHISMCIRDRHDDVRVARYLQVLARDALGLQHGHFLHEHAGVDDHAVADDGHGVLVHDAGRHEVQRQLLVAMHHRVACVVATLVAHDEVEFARDEVGDFTLAFVAPLGTDENRTCLLYTSRCV